MGELVGFPEVGVEVGILVGLSVNGAAEGVVVGVSVEELLVSICVGVDTDGLLEGYSVFGWFVGESVGMFVLGAFGEKVGISVGESVATEKKEGFL